MQFELLPCNTLIDWEPFLSTEKKFFVTNKSKPDPTFRLDDCRCSPMDAGTITSFIISYNSGIFVFVLHFSVFGRKKITRAKGGE